MSRLQIVEDFGDVAAHAVLLIGLLRHTIKRHGNVIQAAPDEVVDVDRLRPVQVGTDVRPDTTTVGMLDDRKNIRIKQRLAMIVERHDQCVFFDSIEHILVLIERKHRLLSSNRCITGRAQRTAKVTDVANIDDEVVR